LPRSSSRPPRSAATCAAPLPLIGSFHEALAQQPAFPSAPLEAAGYLLAPIGGVLVLSTYYRLGITGTYLGDYFGILMSERVTGFPFSVLDDPMYTGSTLLYLADALRAGSPAGGLLTVVVWMTYHIASKYFEGYDNDKGQGQGTRRGHMTG